MLPGSRPSSPCARARISSLRCCPVSWSSSPFIFVGRGLLESPTRRPYCLMFECSGAQSPNFSCSLGPQRLDLVVELLKPEDFAIAGQLADLLACMLLPPRREDHSVAPLPLQQIFEAQKR